MNLRLRTRQIDRREWWLWGFAVVVTVALTSAIVFLTFFQSHSPLTEQYWTELQEWVRGLAALVLLFDVYTIYQHLQLQRIRRELADREDLFHLISENAADMIAVVDAQGRRLYTSPSYRTVLGYSEEELAASDASDQIHPDDRDRVLEAAAKARKTGRGERLEYRIRHKDGSWRIMESTASPIQASDETDMRLVIVNRDITERKRAEELLAHNVFHDGLTNLPNRVLLVDRLRQALLRSRRRKDSSVALLFVDIDEFKVVNDSLGHSAGDHLLIEIGKRLNDCIRGTDTVIAGGSGPSPESAQGHAGLARFGGDKFVLLLEDVSAATDAIRVAKRVQVFLGPAFNVNGHEIVVTASIGIALDSGTHGPEDLLRDAELAMYRAKRTGKARCEVFDPAMHSSAVRRMTLESELRRALENGELIVYYQPIVSLHTGKIAGFEALSRWQRSTGLVSPAEFVPVAEETGLILPINVALMRESFWQLRGWQSEFPDSPLSMSVNVTSRQFAQPDLPEQIGKILEQSGVEPSSVHLEITETLTMEDADNALAKLRRLKALGVHLSVDDFGTGFSSLSRLPRFPIDALKIDRVFISGMMDDKDSMEIVRLIVTMAHTMGLQVVGEGTETAEQAQRLKNMGCELAQGFLYSPPVPCANATMLLAQHVPAGIEMSVAAHAGK